MYKNSWNKMDSTSLGKFILHCSRSSEHEKYLPPVPMKINVKITANKMVGSLCGYTIYRNYLSKKNKLTKIYFILLNLLENI